MQCVVRHLGWGEREMMEIVRGILFDKNENCWKMGLRFSQTAWFRCWLWIAVPFHCGNSWRYLLEIWKYGKTQFNWVCWIESIKCVLLNWYGYAENHICLLKQIQFVVQYHSVNSVQKNSERKPSPLLIFTELILLIEITSVQYYICFISLLLIPYIPL